MSVERDARRGTWVARWREAGRQRSRAFTRRPDAEAWDREVKRRQQLGPLAVTQLTSSAPTLGEWMAERWVPEHGVTLEQSTRERYRNVYELHIGPWLDDVPLNELGVGRLRAWQADRIKAGVGTGTLMKARTLLSSVLRHAAESEAIPGNPLSVVRPPRPPQRDRVRPLAPSTIEALRRALLEPAAREVAASAPGRRPRRRYELPARDPHVCRRDALIVSVLAYAGLRPGELRALRWQDVGERTLLIQRAAAPDGTPKRTKTNQFRTVRLLEALHGDLREWRLASGRPPDQALVIPGPGGRTWTKIDWQIWRRDHWLPACREVGLDARTRPYDLRHSFASLRLAEGKQQLYVARQLGHSPEVLLREYAHLFDEYEDAERIDPEREIAEARTHAGVPAAPAAALST